jgi:hypothetical protein
VPHSGPAATANPVMVHSIGITARGAEATSTTIGGPAVGAARLEQRRSRSGSIRLPDNPPADHPDAVS